MAAPSELRGSGAQRGGRAAPLRREEPLTNPGSFDELHRKCKGGSGPPLLGQNDWGSDMPRMGTGECSSASHCLQGPGRERWLWGSPQLLQLQSSIAGLLWHSAVLCFRGLVLRCDGRRCSRATVRIGEVFPQQMEGVKLIINKALSSHFQVTHTVHMSTVGQSSYHFNTTYVGDRQLSPTEAFPTLVGDIDSSGSLHAQVLHLVAERIRTKAVFQTQQARFMTWQFDGELRGDDCTATLTLGNPDVLSQSVILVAHFLQSVTSRLVLGGEMVYHRRPGEEGAIVTLAGKYTALKWVATLNIGYGGAHASYYHKANEQVQVGVEFEANTRLQDTTFAFGYQLNLPQANVVFRGLLDSNWCVGGVLEKKLPPLPVTLALGAFLNHWKNRFHCGFSVIVG